MRSDRVVIIFQDRLPEEEDRLITEVQVYVELVLIYSYIHIRLTGC